MSDASDIFDPSQHSCYVRLAFTAYWADSSPSAEIFYIPECTLQLTSKDVKSLEAEALGMMQDWFGDRAIRMIYLGSGCVEMTAEDIADAGWYVFQPMTIQLLPVD